MKIFKSLSDLGSVLKNRNVDDPTDDLDFWKIPGKDGELVVKKGTSVENLGTSKSFLDNLENSKKDILGALDLYESTQSHNKVIIIAKKIDSLLVQGLEALDSQDFIKGVNLSKIKFSKENPEEKIYMGVVTDVNKESVVVCIGNILGEPVKYDIPYNKISQFVRKRGFKNGDNVFVDLKKEDKDTTLVDYSEFRQQRINELKENGLEFKGYKTIYYMTRSGKILKGKIIGLGEDINAKQVVFQTEDGKKFPISIEGLKKGIKLAKEKSSSDQNKKFEKDTNQRKSFKKNVRDRELPERVA